MADTLPHQPPKENEEDDDEERGEEFVFEDSEGEGKDAASDRDGAAQESREEEGETSPAAAGKTQPPDPSTPAGPQGVAGNQVASAPTAGEGCFIQTER